MGAATYLLGTVGVTVAANVPLDDALERDPATWPRYLRLWTRWNTVRTAAATAAAPLLLVWRTSEPSIDGRATPPGNPHDGERVEAQ